MYELFLTERMTTSSGPILITVSAKQPRKRLVLHHYQAVPIKSQNRINPKTQHKSSATQNIFQLVRLSICRAIIQISLAV